MKKLLAIGMLLAVSSFATLDIEAKNRCGCSARPRQQKPKPKKTENTTDKRCGCSIRKKKNKKKKRSCSSHRVLRRLRV